LTRDFHIPARSVPGVSHAFDGLLLQQASGPFQTGAAHGVHPSERCSSSDSRAPFGAVTLMLFVVTAVFHSEVVWKITVLRSFKVLLRPWSPCPVGPSSHRGSLLSWVFPLQGLRRTAMAGTSAGLPPRTCACPASEEVEPACASRYRCAMRSGPLLPEDRPS
jgi:hypothetical protein